MALAAIAAAKLAQTDTVVCSQHARIRSRIHSGREHCPSSLFHEGPAVDSGCSVFLHKSHLLLFPL
jgi:hypothetical protein